jgi:hypothetical protein
MTNFPVSGVRAGRGWKKPLFSHHWYQEDSTALGLYAWKWGCSND